MSLTNLEIDKKDDDLKDKIVDLIINSKYIKAEDKDLAWQRLSPSTYFYR